MCSCGGELENTADFLLRCQNHLMNRSNLLKNVYSLYQTFRNYDDDHSIHILVCGSEKFNFNLNKQIIKLTIFYLKDTERFDSLFIESLNASYICS